MAFPEDSFGKYTELFIDGSWVDVSSYVRGSTGVSITRGRKNEKGRVTPTTCNLTLNNTDGRFSNRYPSSPYFGKLGKNLKMRYTALSGPVLDDDFNRTVSASWSGGSFTWTNSAGGADWDINGTHATHTHPDTNVLRYSTADTGGPDHRVRATFKLSAGTLTGANASVWVLGRFTNTSNYYAALVSYETDGDVTIGIYKRVAGALSQVVAPITTHASYGGLFDDYEFTAELYVEGSKLYAKIWDSSNHAEPQGWNLTGTDTSLTTGDSAGVADRRETGNTNSNLEFRYNSFKAVPGWIRCTVEVPSFKQRWDGTGTDIYTPVQGAGIKRRLGQGSKPLRSPLYRAHERAGPIAWWPLEDKRNADTAASGVEGVAPMTIIGKEPGTQLGYPPVDGVPVWEEPGGYGAASMLSLREGGKLHGIVPSSTATSWRFEFNARWDGGTDLGFITIPMSLISNEGVRYAWRIYHTSADGLGAVAGTYDGSVIGLDIGGVGGQDLYDGQVHNIRLDIEQNGANVDGSLYLDGSLVGTDTWASFTTPVPTDVWVNGPDAAESGVDTPSVSHVALYAPIPSSSDTLFATSGWAGELAAIRFARLCAEEDIPYQIVGSSSDTELMGPQRIATLGENFDDIEDVDMGILYEPRHFFGLAYRTRADLYNGSGLELDYSAAHLSDELADDDDDSYIRNDIELSRPDGSSYRAVQLTGPNNIQDPDDDPEGVGRYDETREVNVNEDSQLPHLAEWRRSLGTYNEQARFPAVSLHLHRDVFVNTPALRASVAQTDIGDYFSIQNPLSPPLAPDDIELLAEGYNEKFRNKTWEIRFNNTPGGRYRMGVFDDDDSRYDTSYSTTSGSITTGTSTSLSVATEAGRSLWVTGSGSPQFPLEIDLLGARVSVTAISGASSPQTFTISATVVNGVAKTIPSGTPVRIWRKVRYGL